MLVTGIVLGKVVCLIFIRWNSLFNIHKMEFLGDKPTTCAHWNKGMSITSFHPDYNA